MDKAIFVQEVNSSHGLNEKVESSFFSETTLFFNQNEQVTFRHVFHYQVNVLLIFQICIHPYNVDVLELFMDLDLPPQCLFHLWSLDHALIEFFNGNFNTAWFMQGQLHRAIRAFSKLSIFKL